MQILLETLQCLKKYVMVLQDGKNIHGTGEDKCFCKTAVQEKAKMQNSWLIS